MSQGARQKVYDHFESAIMIPGHEWSCTCRQRRRPFAKPSLISFTLEPKVDLLNQSPKYWSGRHLLLSSNLILDNVPRIALTA